MIYSSAAEDLYDLSLYTLKTTFLKRGVTVSHQSPILTLKRGFPQFDTTVECP